MSPINSHKNYTLITDSGLFLQLIKSCLELPRIGLDTEFMRSDSYFAKPGLIQISDGTEIFLIDPLAVGSISPLGELLKSESVTKIIHSMSEDIDLLFHETKVECKSLFDTQIAATLAGLGQGLGYQNLVKQILDKDIDKSETRSDWLQRPLSESQLAYAASDVEDLLLVHDFLNEELTKKNLLVACREECDSLVSQIVKQAREPQWSYLKIKGGWDLPIDRQMLLQQLVIWRDKTAVEKNLPKAWVFSDAQLLEVSHRAINSMPGLSRTKGMKHKQLKRFGADLIEVVKSFSPSTSLDFVAIEKPLKGRDLALYKELKSEVSKAEQSTGIASSMLGSRKLLERQVVHVRNTQTAQLVKEFSGWRRDILGNSFTSSINNYLDE